MCLLPAYRARVLRGGYGPGLLVLDDLPVSLTEQRSAAAAVEAATGVGTAPVDETGQELQHGHLALDEGGRGALDSVHFGVKVGYVGVDGARRDRGLGRARR